MPLFFCPLLDTKNADFYVTTETSGVRAGRPSSNSTFSLPKLSEKIGKTLPLVIATLQVPEQ